MVELVDEQDVGVDLLDDRRDLAGLRIVGPPEIGGELAGAVAVHGGVEGGDAQRLGHDGPPFAGWSTRSLGPPCRAGEVSTPWTLEADRLVARYRAARTDPRQVVLEGFHAVKHAWRFGAEITHAATPDPAALQALARRLAPDVLDRLHGVAIVPPDLFRRLAPVPPPTGVLALARRPAAGLPPPPKRRSSCSRRRAILAISVPWCGSRPPPVLRRAHDRRP